MTTVASTSTTTLRAPRTIAFTFPIYSVGGREAKTPVEGVGVECMGEAVELGAFRVESFGKDMLLRARVVLQANEGNV